MTIHISDLTDLPRAAAQFVDALGPRRVVAFYGPMGAGKTTFIKAICDVLGVGDVVNSPTFSIVNEYVDADGRTIYHFDFYRLRRASEAYDIGFEDYIDSGNLCLMEWPEIIEEILPDDCVRATINEEPDGSRTVTI